MTMANVTIKKIPYAGAETRKRAVLNGTKLTPDAVREIRKSDKSARELADIYGVYPRSIHKIRTRTMWASVK